VIPGTKIALDQLLFLPGESIRRRFDVREWSICRDNAHTKGSQLGLAEIILNDPDVLTLGSPDSCKVTMLDAAPAAASASEQRISGPGCVWVFSKAGGAFRSVTQSPTPFTPAQYEKCYFRLALFLKGYNGALTLPDAVLFVPYRKSPWSTFPKPPQFVPVLQYLLTGCSTDIEGISRKDEIPQEINCSYKVVGNG
jgi:hypothetical protein